MTGQGQTTIRTISIAAVLTSIAGHAWAQDEPGGVRFTYDVGIGLEATDNLALVDPAEGVTTRANTDLTFGIVSETRFQSLEAAITFDAEYRNEPDADGEFDLRVPAGRIAYSRTGANSAFSFGARLSQVRLDDTILTFLDENLNPVDLVFDGGDLRRLTADALLSFGIEGPIGADLSVRFDDRDYIDTADPDLFDRRTVTVAAGTRLRFSSVATGRLEARVIDYDAEDVPQTERTTYILGAGVDYAVSPATTVSFDIDYNQIEETLFGIPQETVDGFGFRVGAVRGLPNGSIDGSLSRTVNTDGTTRNLISVGREMDLPRGSLQFGLGYSYSDTGEDTVVANISAVRDFSDGSLRAALEQRVAQNDQNEDTLVTRASLRYNQDVNSVSDFSVNLGVGRTEDLTVANGGITTRADLELIYTRDFVAELDWSVGYRGRYLDEPGTSSRVSNSVFTRIERSFSIRP